MCCVTARTRVRSHRRQRRVPSMPRATTSPTAGASPIQSSTPSVEEAPPVQQPSSDTDILVTLAAPAGGPALPPVRRQPPTALNLSQSRRARRKKSVMSMPRVLPSPTVPLLHRIPNSINFPRLAGSPTPPPRVSSTSSESDDERDEDEDEARSSPASRRSFPDDWEAAARHRLLGRRGSDHLETVMTRPPRQDRHDETQRRDYHHETTTMSASRRDSDHHGIEAALRRRTFDDPRTTVDADADALETDDWQSQHGG